MDAIEKKSGLPRPSAGIRFSDGFLRIAPISCHCPLILLLITDGAISVLSSPNWHYFLRTGVTNVRERSDVPVNDGLPQAH
jgi:hypothetical protein